MNRRRFLELATLGTFGVAGCTGGPKTSPPTTRTSPPPERTRAATSPQTDTASPTETDQPTATESPTPTPLPSEFVRRDGTQFTVGGDQFLFSGVNSCCLAEGYTSRARVDDVLADLPALNADVLRLPIRSAGERSNCGAVVDGCSLSFQPAPGEYNETAFEHLDYIVAEAGRRGIRLIVPLVDNWGADEGINQYVAWSETATSHAEFYTDERAQQLYRDFIEHLLTRTNTVTGRTYRDDPTIMMWELGNEPRPGPDLSAFLTWIERTAAHIHQLDSNHLVSTGSDIYPESAYVDIHRVDGIDACSIHFWPQNWDHDDEPVAYAREYLRSRARLGTQDVGKPVYIGEYGWFVNLQADSTDEQLRRRAELFRQWHDIILDTEISGALAWDLMGDNRLEYHRSRPDRGRTVSFACPEHQVCAPLVAFANEIDDRSSVQ